jgi:hypothetical protein
MNGGGSGAGGVGGVRPGGIETVISGYSLEKGRMPAMGQEGEKRTERKRPIRVKKPNAETLAAMEELEAGKGERAASVAEMMAKLNADD